MVDTAVILYSDSEGNVCVWGGDVGWGGGVDSDELVGGNVVGGAGGYTEEVLIRHIGACNLGLLLWNVCSKIEGVQEGERRGVAERL